MSAPLLDALAPVVRHATRLAAKASAAAPIEVECRTQIAAPHTFYALVHQLERRAAQSWFTALDDLLCPARDDEAAPLRVTYSSGADARLQYALHKRRILRAPLDVQLAGGQRWRVDAAQEHYRTEWCDADEARVNEACESGAALHRAKERASFVLSVAPAWRVDATRVVEQSAAAGALPPPPRFELELELARFDAPSDALLAQASALLDALGVR